MKKLDKMIEQARPSPSYLDQLGIDNPYMEKSYEELIDMLSGDHYTAPPMHTPEWELYIYATVHAASSGKGLSDDSIPTWQPEPKQESSALQPEPDPMAAFNRLYGGG